MSKITVNFASVLEQGKQPKAHVARPAYGTRAIWRDAGIHPPNEVNQDT